MSGESSDTEVEINPWTKKPYSMEYYEIKKKRLNLPVYQFQDDLIDAIAQNQITIVEGETGSGKTTQIPQFLLEANLIPPDKKIVCTQPRRVAATSVAQRVANELDVECGDIVGYVVRFESRTTDRTRLIYMTDGLLLKEFVEDPDIEKYGIVIIDEAHERNINSDIIIGLLKQLVERRSDIHVVIMSATLEIEKFQSFFGEGTPLLKVPGRQYKVDIIYLEEPCGSYLDEAVTCVCEIHQKEKPGGILLFLTGEEEIKKACNRIKDKISAMIAKSEKNTLLNPVVLPLYAQLPPSQQQEVFKPINKNERKIIVSTNLAETSVTIDGIVYVVDPGFVKQNQYDPKRHMSQLIVVPVSQAAANQRAGRAGRTQNGKCFRLYTEAAFNTNLTAQTVPEILRSEISQVILTMLATGITDIVNFPFLDRPPLRQMLAAVEDLYFLNAITIDGQLTEDGKKIALIPLEPRLSKTVISSYKFNCSYQVALIVAILGEAGALFERPERDAVRADAAHEHFIAQSGDHVTFLNVLEEYLDQPPREREGWCIRNFINPKFLSRVDKSRKQIIGIMESMKIPIQKIKRNDPMRDTLILKSLLEGSFQQISMFEEKSNHYTFLFSNREADIHRSSNLKFPGKWILYSGYIFTKADNLITVSNIDPLWAYEASPAYFQPDDFEDSFIKRELFSDKILGRFING